MSPIRPIKNLQKALTPFHSGSMPILGMMLGEQITVSPDISMTRRSPFYMRSYRRVPGGARSYPTMAVTIPKVNSQSPRLPATALFRNFLVIYSIILTSRFDQRQQVF
jgi:hypothetical protein